MYKRILIEPTKSFFLLGPRGTGKSTWLNSLEFDFTIDLLNSNLKLLLLRDPHHIVELTGHLPNGSWILIDEIQKIPELLDEVHYLYEKKRFNFALSGSSARKIKRTQGNLLAGRAINKEMFTFCYPEYSGKISLKNRIEWGLLPLVVDNFKYKEDTLDTYLDNYLRQELVEEGLIRKLEPFARFLQVAGILNGTVLNIQNVSRECHVNRTTVDKYFQVLYDTLVAFRLPAFTPGLKVKEQTSAKFYFFDSGVARACAGLTREDLDRSYCGFLFETYCINEIRAYNSYKSRGRDLFYYNVSGSMEIDLVIQLKKKTFEKPSQIIAIEIKMSDKWDAKWSKKLNQLIVEESKLEVTRLIGIYTGSKRLTVDNVDVFPVDQFLEELFSGNIF